MYGHHLWVCFEQRGTGSSVTHTYTPSHFQVWDINLLKHASTCGILRPFIESRHDLVSDIISFNTFEASTGHK